MRDTLMVHATESLLACIGNAPEAAKIDRLKGYTAKDWEETLTAAMRYGVAPILFHTLKPLFPALNVPEAVREKMRWLYLVSAAHNMRLYNQLSNIIGRFNAHKISVILLKGAHLAEFVYGNSALRPMQDIDLLVRKKDLPMVHALLVEDGYVSTDENQGSSQVHMAPYWKQGGVRVEIHFHIVEPPLSRQFDVAGLWDRARRGSFQETDVLMLCPEDLMLHLAGHAAIYHGFDNGLIPYVDISRLAAHYEGELDWDRLWRRAREWGLDRSVYLVLALAEKLCGLPMPEQIRSNIKPDAATLNAIDTAESLIYETGPSVPKFIASLFRRQGWRIKLKTFLGRAFPPMETMQASADKNRLHLYRLYWLRLRALLKKHGKTVWAGLIGSPETVRGLELANKKNRLRDWLTHNGKKP